jgi:hypothetical protein
MTKMKALLSVALGALMLLAASASQAVLLGVVQPCLSAAASSINMLPINGGNQTYCQTAFGWSDTWFAASQPATYDAHQDVLSGDNAPSLFLLAHLGEGSGAIGSGNPLNFISPFLDAGTLNALPIGSDWQILNDISVNGNVGTSDIFLPFEDLGQLDAHLVTTVGPNGVTEQFTFTNNFGCIQVDDTTACLIIDALYFDDYFNFHANGSAGAVDTQCPTTAIENGNTIHTVGSNAAPCSAIVHDGIMFGSFNGVDPVNPDWFYLGLATSVLGDIATNGTNTTGLTGSTLNNSNPVTGDGAGDLVWNLGGLDTGQSVTFTIVKERAPEPATLGLFGLGLLALGFFRRRR